MMESLPTSSSAPKKDALFKVFLRLRPPHAGTGTSERFLTVEPPAPGASTTSPTHVTLTQPSARKHTADRYCFTQVLGEDASQLDVFHCTGIVPLIEGVLAPHGGDGTDALVSTLGVTGSGKTHTILGSRSQRGMTQLALDVLFRSIGSNIADGGASVEDSIRASDASEATILSAPIFLETVFSDASGPSRANSRAPTPMLVRHPSISYPPLSVQRSGSVQSELDGLRLPGAFPHSPKSVRIVRREDYTAMSSPVSPYVAPIKKSLGRANAVAQKGFMSATFSANIRTANTKTAILAKGESSAPPPTPRRHAPRPEAYPTSPDVSAISVSSDPSAEYAVLISMYELYNNSIHDLLTPPVKSTATSGYRRRQLLFKPTELSPDRKVIAGLKKILCTNLSQALMVLEAGLPERSTASTMSNRTSSRSHGFFCVEVKKRSKSRRHGLGGGNLWGESTLTILDLAGSERARDTKTTGATLAEAGKINESLMYFGQCLQLASVADGGSMKSSNTSFRHCKLTDILFSNSFAAVNLNKSHSTRRAPQNGVLIVTADPHGDFSATKSIFQYSALASEAMAPRVPSISLAFKAAAAARGTQASQSSARNSSMLLPSSPLSSPSTTQQHSYQQRSFFSAGGADAMASSPNVQRTFSPVSNSSSSSEERATMEAAALEIARQAEEIEYMRHSLQTERARRIEAEASLMEFEERVLELEQDIREECVASFDQRLVLEMARWKASAELERERNEELWDRKLEIYDRLQVTVTSPPGGVEVYDENQQAYHDGDDKENMLVENLEEQNERLRREVAVLKRELAGRSPSKRRPLMEREDLAAAEDGPWVVAATTAPPTRTGAEGGHRNSSNGNNLQKKMEQLRVSDAGRGSGVSTSSRATGTGSPRKVRKLATKRWDAISHDDDDDMF